MSTTTITTITTITTTTTTTTNNNRDHPRACVRACVRACSGAPVAWRGLIRYDMLRKGDSAGRKDMLSVLDAFIVWTFLVGNAFMCLTGFLPTVLPGGPLSDTVAAISRIVHLGAVGVSVFAGTLVALLLSVQQGIAVARKFDPQRRCCLVGCCLAVRNRHHRGCGALGYALAVPCILAAGVLFGVTLGQAPKLHSIREVCILSVHEADCAPELGCVWNASEGRRFEQMCVNPDCNRMGAVSTAAEYVPCSVFHACVHACVPACPRACAPAYPCAFVRACAPACVRARACVRACVWCRMIMDGVVCYFHGSHGWLPAWLIRQERRGVDGALTGLLCVDTHTCTHARTRTPSLSRLYLPFCSPVRASKLLLLLLLLLLLFVRVQVRSADADVHDRRSRPACHTPARGGAAGQVREEGGSSSGSRGKLT